MGTPAHACFLCQCVYIECMLSLLSCAHSCINYYYAAVPAVNILGDHVTTERTNVSHDQIPEPLSMDIKGKKRVISAAYGINIKVTNYDGT